MYERYPTLTKMTVGLLFLVLLVYSAEAAKEILVPVMLSALFAYLLHPIARRLEGWKIPRFIADIATVVFASAILVAVFFFFYKQMGIFLHDIPAIREQAIHNMGSVESYIDDHVSFAPKNQDHWLQANVIKLINSSEGQIAATFTGTATSLLKLLILPFVIFFLLFYRERFRDFVLEMVPDRKHEVMETIIEEVSQVTKRYMGGLFVVVSIIATLNCISLSLIGIKYAVFLGLLAATFNFIPYFGTPVGAVIPILVTFLTNESPKKAIFVIVYFFCIQLLEHNLLTPKITGSQVRINPLVTIFSILIGAMMFGVPGMFLAIPFTGMFKILCEHVESLKPLGKIIGEPETPGRSLIPRKK